MIFFNLCDLKSKYIALRWIPARTFNSVWHVSWLNLTQTYKSIVFVIKDLTLTFFVIWKCTPNYSGHSLLNVSLMCSSHWVTIFSVRKTRVIKSRLYFLTKRVKHEKPDASCFVSTHVTALYLSNKGSYYGIINDTRFSNKYRRNRTTSRTKYVS